MTSGVMFILKRKKAGVGVVPQSTMVLPCGNRSSTAVAEEKKQHQQAERGTD